MIRTTDECESLPCLNNGICIDMVAGFRCECGERYEGLTCETGTSLICQGCLYGIENREYFSAKNINHDVNHFSSQLSASVAHSFGRLPIP